MGPRNHEIEKNNRGVFKECWDAETEETNSLEQPGRTGNMENGTTERGWVGWRASPWIWYYGGVNQDTNGRSIEVSKRAEISGDGVAELQSCCVFWTLDMKWHEVKWSDQHLSLGWNTWGTLAASEWAAGRWSSFGDRLDTKYEILRDSRFCMILHTFLWYLCHWHADKTDRSYCAGQGACELDARSHRSPWRWDWDEVSCECLQCFTVFHSVSGCLTMFLCLFDFVCRLFCSQFWIHVYIYSINWHHW